MDFMFPCLEVNAKESKPLQKTEYAFSSLQKSKETNKAC